MMTKQNKTSEMTNLRILHLSNLLIGGTKGEGERIFGHLKRWAHNEKAEKQIDYLIICGNITCDGKAASFEAAAKVLRDLADFLLTSNKDTNNEDTNLIRLLVVPGVKDILLTEDTGLDFSRFRLFYDELFKDEIKQKKIMAFDPDTVIVRHFTGLTLVGACYWTYQRGVKQRKEMLRRFGKAIKKIKEYQEAEHENWGNYSLTPTLLATSETPLLSPGVYAGRNSQIDELQGIMEEGQIKTTLHLFGESATPLLAPQPFAFSYLSLGIGPRGKNSFWPLQLNLVEINHKTCLSQTASTPLGRCPSLDICGLVAPEDKITLLRHTAYRLDGDNYDWRHHSYEDGSLDNFCKLRTPERSSASVFEETLKQVSKQLQHGWPFVAVRGITGSGKRDLYSELGQKKFFSGNGTRYCVTQLFLDKLDHYKHPEHLVTKLHEKFKECAAHKEHTGLAIIYDAVYSRKENTDKVQIRDVVDKLLENTNDYRGGVIYFVTETDFIQGYDPPPQQRKPVTGPGLPELEGHPSVGWVILEPLIPTVMERMITDYSCWAPIIPKHINNVTGRYAGFSKIILENLKEDFGKKDGTTLITRKMIIEMIERALQEDKAMQRSQGIVHRILKAAGGNKIHGYIQNDLQARMDRFQSDWAKIFEDLQQNPVILDLDKIKKEYPDRMNEIGVRNSLDDLRRFGVFDESFRLMVVGPYLLAASRGWQILEPSTYQETEIDGSVEPKERSDDLFDLTDVHSVAELLSDTGLTVKSSRRTLCLQIGIKPNLVPFLNIDGDNDFAHELVEWLNNRVSVKSFNLLFDILETNLENYKKDSIKKFRKKLTENNDDEMN